MNILGTLAGWAKSAFGFVTGLGGRIGDAYSAVWHYISNVHNALSWITGYAQLHALISILRALGHHSDGLEAIRKALRRLPRWLWLTMINPAVTRLSRRIAALAGWTRLHLFLLWLATVRLVAAERAARIKADRAERAQRIAAVSAEHAAMLKAVAACLSTVQRQAATGYNMTLHDRMTVVGKLLNDLADRSPAVKGLVSDLVSAMFDLETIDNPVARFLVSHLLSQVVAHLGIDQATGELIAQLLGPIAGQPKASGLQDVTRDIGGRLNVLEGQWAQFMHDGGEDVEDAGSQWKTLSALTVDAALLGFFGLAVGDPSAWATGVADTVGAAGNATLDAVFRLIK